MPELKDLEIGVFFWAEPDVAALIRQVKSLGVRIGQLGVTGDVPLGPQAVEQWKSVLEAEGFHLVTIFAAYDGESYDDIPTVQRTVGFIPEATRAAREVRTREVIDFAAGLGVSSFGCHVGYVPHDPAAPGYVEVRDMVRRVADYAAGHGMTFCLETGQEPAAVLLKFFEDVNRPNVRINFDPANMVLYGSGDPIEAFGLLARHVVSVHGKDGDWPPAGQPGALGTERALGEGSVNLPEFIRTLRAHGYRGTIHVESGVHGEEQRWQGLKAAVDYLKGLTG